MCKGSGALEALKQRLIMRKNLSDFAVTLLVTMVYKFCGKEKHTMVKDMRSGFWEVNK